jgi:ADP-heptose:LPS heptosyltransferase
MNKAPAIMEQSIHSICIIHLNQIGDFVFSLPLLKALHERYPHAAIDSVIRPSLQELFTAVPWVTRTLIRTRGFAEKISLLGSIRRSRYDLLISLPRSEEAMLIAAASGARIKAGFVRRSWNRFLNVSVPLHGHNSWRNNAALLHRLGVPVKKNDYVGLLDVDEDIYSLELPDEYVVISPATSARRTAKSWLPEKFAAVMRQIYGRWGLTPVLVGSPADSPANSIIQERAEKPSPGEPPAPVINLTGRIGLRTLCAVLKKARLFVGIDSGVMHLASCADIPVVALFGPTDPYYVGPQNNQSRIIKDTALDCVPCYLKKCRERACMKNITARAVIGACEELLGDHCKKTNGTHPAPSAG